MNVLFVSDLHLGHRTILEHGRKPGTAPRGGETVEEHDEWVIEQLLSVSPGKRTLWWLLGDVAMEVERLTMLDRLPGRKFLILGNHDLFDTQVYLKHVERIYGSVKKYGFWLSHIPVHSELLYGMKNIHGHNHKHELREDERYFNTAIEWLPGQRPISLDEVRELIKEGN